MDTSSTKNSLATSGRAEADVSPDHAAELRGKGIRLVAGSLIGMAGVAHAKYVPVRRLAAFGRAGMGVSPSWSVFCVDGSIAFTPGMSPIGDLRLRISAEDVRVVDDGVAWAPGDLCDQQGTPVPLCTRGLLARAERRAAERGFGVMVGGEIECTMLNLSGEHASDQPWTPYGLRPSLDRSAFLVDLADTADAAGLEFEQIHTEFGHDQLEVSLAPASPVAAADSIVLARIVLSRVALRHNLRISFSPLPFEAESGNGAHLHMSLIDASGPLLSGGDGVHGVRVPGASALAGVIDTLPDLLGVYAGSAVSAARLQPGNWAGATAGWGLENREAALRLIAATPGNPQGANMELKVVDPSANPYLAVAAFLESALRGIALKLPLPPELGAEPPAAGAGLPADHLATLAVLESSTAAAEVLTPEVVEAVIAVRRREAALFGDQPLADTAAELRLAWSC